MHLFFAVVKNALNRPPTFSGQNQVSDRYPVNSLLSINAGHHCFTPEAVPIFLETYPVFRRTLFDFPAVCVLLNV